MLTLRFIGLIAASLASLFSPTGELTAEEIQFPPGANVVNVVTDLGIDNTGQSDVAPQLNAIIEKLAKQPCVLYFPKGTYLVASRVRGTHNLVRKEGNYKVGPFLIGESRTETVIRLKDGTWPKDPFGDVDTLTKTIDEQVVLHSGDSTNTTFRQIIQNLTVNIGRNNAGATGIVYITSNNGHLDGVDIVSEDGQGALGLALTGIENGPGLVRDVAIRGFKRGIFAATPYNFVLHDITVLSSGPSLINKGRLSIEDLMATRSTPGPAIINRGSMTMLGAKLVGDGDDALANDFSFASLQEYGVQDDCAVGANDDVGTVKNVLDLNDRCGAVFDDKGSVAHGFLIKSGGGADDAADVTSHMNLAVQSEVLLALVGQQELGLAGRVDGRLEGLCPSIIVGFDVADVDPFLEVIFPSQFRGLANVQPERSLPGFEEADWCG